MSATEFLLYTKLKLPPVRTKVVRRTRVQALLDEGMTRCLTLISAPAGFGKTTLLGEWRHQGTGQTVAAWLSLDSDDSDIAQFLSYVSAAIGTVEPGLGESALALVRSPQPPAVKDILIALINDLSTLQNPCVLILDDYHVIRSQAVHQAVTYLLDHLPEQAHLVIATRSDPPLPLARLRARDQLVEIRADDLRFTTGEVAEFFERVMNLSLAAADISTLETRTEGWIAGLQMAALSLRDREDVTGFIEGFSGTNRYIMDYLLEEVLANQPPEVQRFLLHTSILERLTAPLCDAVLTNDDATQAGGDGRSAGQASGFGLQSASILDYLERANLFLVPLDDERVWYRYHHLFSDLLRTQLRNALDTAGVARLHICAADWHAHNGSVLEAIHHASAASDEERVERFIKQSYRELVSRGEQAGMRFWKGRLSRDLVYRRPWLCIYEAYSHSWFGELDEADRLLAAAEKHVQPLDPSPDARLMQAHLAYVKSRVAAMRGDMQQAIAFCRRARDYVPADDLAMRLDTNITLGYEYFLSGDYDNAHPALSETLRWGVATGAVINTVAASCLLARLYAARGKLNEAYGAYELAAQAIPDTGEHFGARALIEVGIADVLCERNELEGALFHLRQGLAMLPMWDKADDWALAYVTLMRIYLAQMNSRRAAEALERAAGFLKTRAVFPEARRAVETARVRLWLAQGDLAAAGRWAASRAERLSSDGSPGYEYELHDIALARVWMAQGRFEEAVHLLSQLEETARSAGRMGRVLEILLLEAVALHELGDSEQALAALTKCLALAMPEGYAMVFLENGQPVQRLLARWLARAGAGPLRDHATLLLNQFGPAPVGLPGAAGRSAPAGDLLEPLSPRELEVLNLMALGHTNRAIAEQLIISPGTVKAHTSSIYRKLDVANRTEAVGCARQLGILP